MSVLIWRRIVAALTAVACVAAALALIGPARADTQDPPGSTGTSSEPSSVPETAPSSSPPTSNLPTSNLPTSSLPTSSLPTSSLPSSGSPTSPTTSGDPTPVRDGILNLWVVDVTTGDEVVGVPVRIWRPEIHDTTMPAAVVLPPGHYRVEILAVPGGYRLVSSWAANPVVTAGGSVDVIFQVAAQQPDRGRVPIQSIPSGRTR